MAGRTVQEQMADNERKMIAKIDAEIAKKKPTMPEYEIPEASYKYLDLISKLKTPGIPGVDVIKEEMGAGLAGTVGDVQRTADTSAGALGALSGLYNKYTGGVRDLYQRDKELEFQQQQSKLMAEMEGQKYLADYEERKGFGIPYLKYQTGMNEYWSELQRMEERQYRQQALDAQQKMARNQMLFGLGTSLLGSPMAGNFLGNMTIGGSGQTKPLDYSSFWNNNEVL